MRPRILRFLTTGIFLCSLLSTAMQAQSEAAVTYKTNCALCHGADGSGNTGTGKALHAQDLRSNDTQKQTDAALDEVISKGRGKMPAFGAKIKPDAIQQLVAYIRTLPTKN